MGGGGAAYLAMAHLSCPTSQELLGWFILPNPCLRRHPPKFSPIKTGPPQASKGLEGLQGPLRARTSISAFPGHLRRRPGKGPPSLTFDSHSKGEGSPTWGSCPSSWRCSSRFKKLFRGWVRPKQAWVGINQTVGTLTSQDLMPE